MDFGKGGNSKKSNFWVSENSELWTSPKVPVRFASSILSENVSDIVWDELRSILPRINFLLDFFQVSILGNTRPERKRANAGNQGSNVLAFSFDLVFPRGRPELRLTFS